MLLLISIIALSYSTAFAQENNPCSAAKSQIELSRCYDEQYRLADRKLNEVYNRLLVTLRPEHKEKVKEAQMTWSKFRDQHCDSETYFSIGGSVHNMELSICLATLTKARIEQLNRMLKDVTK